jgi:hypothetical protein
MLAASRDGEVTCSMSGFVREDEQLNEMQNHSFRRARGQHPYRELSHTGVEWIAPRIVVEVLQFR